ncbi:MAG: hypothetical protein KBT35_08605 [Firmicutes bacterium]|nr:hypothetical protein [Candidatus Colivicinus equi]
MKKKVLFIMFLIVINTIGICYLLSIKINKPYQYIIATKPIVLLQKELVLDDIDNYVFDNYFDVFSFVSYSVNYSFSDDELSLLVKTDMDEYRFNYQYKIKEPIVIEKEVIKEVYIEQAHNESIDGNNTIDDVEEEHVQEEGIVFEGYRDLTFKVGTDISDIVYALTKDIVCNVQISIDYSSLNTSIEGCYPVNYYYEGMCQTVNIYIEN